MIYGFLLGSSPQLAKDEIIGVLNRWQIRWQEVSLSEEVFCLSLEAELPKALFFELGGAIRLLKIERTFPLSNTTSFYQELLPAILESIAGNVEVRVPPSGRLPKVNFAISATPYSLPKRELIGLAKEVKARLKRRGLKSRFLSPKTGTALNAKVLDRYALLEEGEELFLFRGKKVFVLAKTLAVQNIDEWARRDVGKPSRDLKKGLLPPKLARMMVNLAVDFPSSQKVRILDPFCGSGSVLIEALLLGFEAVGLDVDQSQVDASLKNLAYIEENFGRLPSYRVYCADALKLSQLSDLQPRSFTAVVSEVYLGPPLKTEPAVGKQKKWASELGHRYLHFLKESKAVLKEGAKLVLAVPRWSEFGAGEKILDEISPLGYSLLKSYIYHRVGQFVSREVLVLKNL